MHSSSRRGPRRGQNTVTVSWLKSRLFLDSWKFLRSGIRHLRATGLHSSLPAAGRRTALRLDPRRHRGAGVPLLMLSQLPRLCPHCSFSRPLFRPGPRTVIFEHYIQGCLRSLPGPGAFYSYTPTNEVADRDQCSRAACLRQQNLCLGSGRQCMALWPRTSHSVGDRRQGKLKIPGLVPSRPEARKKHSPGSRQLPDSVLA